MSTCGHQSTLQVWARPSLGLRAPATLQARLRQQQNYSSIARSERITDQPVQWKETLLALSISGAVGGTLLDGIHSRVPLQV